MVGFCPYPFKSSMQLAVLKFTIGALSCYPRSEPSGCSVIKALCMFYWVLKRTYYDISKNKWLGQTYEA